MTVVYIVSKSCGCAQLRTLDKAEAVAQAEAQNLILDAIQTRSEAAERKALTGDIVLSCECDQEASDQ